MPQTTDPDMSDAMQGPLTETGAYAFDQMTTIAQGLALPQRHHRDLYVHDRRAVMNLAPESTFAWGLGESSTHIVDGRTSITDLREIDDAMGGLLWAFFDGRTLIRGSVAHVASRLQNVREHREFLANEGRRARAGAAS